MNNSIRKFLLSRRNILKILASTALMPGSVLLNSCKEGKGETSTSDKSKLLPTTSRQVNIKGKEIGFDLTERIHMATLRHRGIFIDFGTSDYFKYTLGRWKTGWGKNLVRNSIHFTEAKGETTRVYFPWFEKADGVMKIRLAPQKAKYVSVYVNNKPLKKIDFAEKEFRTYACTIPSIMLKRGENYLLFRWRGEGKIDKKETAVWVDYINIIEKKPGLTDEIRPLPTQQSILTSTNFTDEKSPVPAICLYPGCTLSYFIQIPKGNLKPTLAFYYKLSLSSNNEPNGKTKSTNYNLTVSIREDGQSSETILEEKLNSSSRNTFKLSGREMGKYAGKTVQLDISFRRFDSAPSTTEKLLMVRAGIYVSNKNFSTSPTIIRGKNRAVARNTILLMIDTLRADHVRSFRKCRVKTPVLDRIAEEGAIIENFSAVEDWTKPSCATMLTGLYPDTHKAQTETIILSADAKMISEELKEKGFTTGAFIANGYISDKFGFKRGWDFYENYIRERKNTEAENVFKRASQWILKNKNSRFFAYIHTIDPHVPYNPPRSFLQLYDPEPYDGPVVPNKTHLQIEEIKKGKLTVNNRDKRRIKALYKGEISYHDKYLGWFMQRLAENNLLENTLIIITSDHGEEFWEHGSVGHGHSIFQELVHVPLIVFWKGKIPGGIRIKENHDHSIIFPSIIDGLGFEIPPYTEGNSILPKIFGQDEPYPHGGFSTHQGDRMGVWSGNLKLQMNGPINTFLYDLDTDPACRKNIYKRNPIKLRYMRTLLGMFNGAPDRRNWKVAKLFEEKKRKIKTSEVQWDDELKRQLKVLGYVHE